MIEFPPITICIGCYNQGQYLEGAIQSALAQTYPNIDILVSDDASTDGTGDLVNMLRERHKNIHFFRQPENLGVAANNSWLLSQPNTEFAVRLDSDDRLEPSYVMELSNLLRAHPKAGFAHCHSNQIDNEGNVTRVRRMRPRPEYENAEQSLRKNARGMQVAANNIMYRTVAAREAGFFTIGMAFCEDWDLLAKIACKGWGNAYTPQILANYRVWSDALGVRARRKMSEVETTIYVYEKTLATEYERRGWDVGPLNLNRRMAAVIFAEAMDSPLFSREDRKVFKRLLIRLGDSLSLRLHLLLVQMGAGGLIRARQRYLEKLKDAVKSVLDQSRERRRAS
jgi:hypothetical protein